MHITRELKFRTCFFENFMCTSLHHSYVAVMSQYNNIKNVELWEMAVAVVTKSVCSKCILCTRMYKLTPVVFKGYFAIIEYDTLFPPPSYLLLKI